MKDLRKLLPKAAKAELHAEVRNRLSGLLSLNINGELKTYIKLEVKQSILDDFKYLKDYYNFSSLYEVVFKQALSELWSKDGK